MSNNWDLITRYRPLLVELVSRDLKIKYRKSFFGYLWSLLNPLLMMWILTLVFSYVFRFDIQNYPLYLIIGQVVFGFISESTSQSMVSIIGNAALLKKIYIPKIVFPIARVASSFIITFFSMLAILIVMIFTDVQFSASLVLLPVAMIILFIFSLGVSLILASITVYFRDMMHLYGVFITAWSFLTPIFYPISIVPEEFREFLFLNPLFYILEYFRDIILNGIMPTVDDTLLCVYISIGMLLIGMFIFKKLENKFLLYI